MNVKSAAEEALPEIAWERARLAVSVPVSMTAASCFDSLQSTRGLTPDRRPPSADEELATLLGSAVPSRAQKLVLVQLCTVLEPSHYHLAPS